MGTTEFFGLGTRSPDSRLVIVDAKGRISSLSHTQTGGYAAALLARMQLGVGFLGLLGDNEAD